MAFQILRVSQQGKLIKDEEGWNKLACLPGPLYILSIIGMARSGKSSLLNMLMAHFNPEFQGQWLETSALAQVGNTEGIWGLACEFPFFETSSATPTPSASSPSTPLSTPFNSHTSSSSASASSSLEVDTSSTTSSFPFPPVSPSSSSRGTLLLLDTQGLEMGGGLDRLLTFSTLLSSELLIMALTALNDMVLKELQVMTMVGQKVATNTHFPNLSLVLRTGLHFGGTSTNVVLDSWLSVTDPRRNANLDTTRDQIRRLFTKNRRLFTYRVASTSTTDILDGSEEWSSKLNSVRESDPEFYKHFIGLAAELVPKMEPKQFHGIPLGGRALVEVADLMLVSLNNEAKFDVDTSFGEVFFTKALPEIKESLHTQLGNLNFDGMKAVVEKADEICVQALDAFGELLTPNQERRLRRMVLEMVSEWVVAKAREARVINVERTRLNWATLMSFAAVTPPRYASLWLIFALLYIRNSFKHLLGANALRNSPFLSWIATLLIKAGILDGTPRLK